MCCWRRLGGTDLEIAAALQISNLKRHPRFRVHFTPTSSSWLNMVERFFRDLTQNRLRRGLFRDVEELITAIGDYIRRHNENPKPFIGTAKASDILEKVKRARKSLNLVQSVGRTTLVAGGFGPQKARPGDHDLGNHARLESVARSKNDFLTAQHSDLATGAAVPSALIRDEFRLLSAFWFRGTGDSRRGPERP